MFEILSKILCREVAMKKIDFHSHIIHGIDDGAQNVKVALDMLKDSFYQGADIIVATPHFKGSNTDIKEFINRRNFNFKELMQKAKETSSQIPYVYLGAEVAICPGVSKFEDLNSLCIEGTNCILLEMPNSYWYDAIFDEIYKIIVKRGLTPIIAHVDRYHPKKTGVEQYYKLFAMDVVLQINASGFCSFFSRKKITKLIRNNIEHRFVIGSDCHDLRYRKNYFKKAYNQIKRCFGKEFLNEVFLLSEKILQKK